MFCNQCGVQLNPHASFCQHCGGAVAENPPVSPQHQQDRRLNTLGALWMAMGALCLIPALLLGGVGEGFHLVGGGPHFWHPMPFGFLFGAGLLFGIGGLAVGWGLLHREPWARTAAIIAGVLFLFRPLLGTLLGIFTLWVLLSDRRSNMQRARY